MNELTTIDHQTGEVVSSDIYPDTTAELVAIATERANALKPIIEQKHLYLTIQGKKHVLVDGWVTLAAMFHVIPYVVESEELDNGAWRAIVELRNKRTGHAITRAFGRCGDADDGDWARRPTYARESMASTRATSKACRTAFAWVMTLAGYQSTPAEEMIGLPPPKRAADATPSPPPKKMEGPGEITGDLKITRGQIEMIQRMLARAGMSEGDVCTALDVESDTVASIPMKQFDEALALVRSRG